MIASGKDDSLREWDDWDEFPYREWINSRAKTQRRVKIEVEKLRS